MKTKNKMKDFDVESKEWWEVTNKYFCKELEKNLNHLNFLVTMEVLNAYVNIDALEDQGHC
jgi:hypothetical protein